MNIYQAYPLPPSLRTHYIFIPSKTMLQYYTHLAEFQPAPAMARLDFLLEKQTRKSENFMQIMSDIHRSIAESCEKCTF